jgi:hypothetical protein
MPMRLFSILRVSAKARWRSASLPSPLAGSGRPQWALAVAAILHQEGQEVAGALKIHGIDDRAAVFTRRQQLRARENGDMERQGVVRHLKPPRDVTRRHAVRPALNEQTEDFQAALLCQGAKRGQYFHVSRHMETMGRESMRLSPVDPQRGRPASRPFGGRRCPKFAAWHRAAPSL